MSTCRFCGKPLVWVEFLHTWAENSPKAGNSIMDILCINSTKMWGVNKVHQPKEDIVQQLLKEVDEV